MASTRSSGRAIARPLCFGAKHMSKDFSNYDTRGYKTLSVIDGYAEWSATYDQLRAEQDLIDRPMLDACTSVEWPKIISAVDLACGTGRVGAYLSSIRQIRQVDGIDVSSAMLDRARSTQVYRHLAVADVCATTLESSFYDLGVCAMAACHLEDLPALYRESARIIRPGGVFILIDFHQYFLLQGIPTHFDRASGESVAIRNVVHLTSDHVRGALQCGWQLIEMQERLIDDDWLNKAPRMKNYRNRPVGFMLVWKRLQN